MALDVRLLRSPKEPTLFAIGVVLSAIVWIVLAVTIVGLMYGFFILLFILMAHALFLAHVKGNGVRISERQLPGLYARVKAAAERLGMAEVPAVYLLQSGGVLNAFATKLLSRKFVIIYSSLADGCQDPRQLDFIIGHELGHLAAGHLQWNAFLAPYRLMPWLGPAYSRAREYTCDRYGLTVAGDLEQSARGLAVLAAGGKQAASVDLAAFEEQRLESGSFWMSVLELVSSHPYLCKRAAALREFAQPGSVKPVARNALAYPLAPLFGVAAAPAGGANAAMIVVLMVGIMTVLAIRGVRQFEERAKTTRGAALQTFGGFSEDEHAPIRQDVQSPFAPAQKRLKQKP